ncbi:MAG: (2Fe-2S) ferredoxin domain-containing protein [Geobacteraceae bacterium]|nr:(2Fe-2S) ferredoxin domain-containing protein [Geobacteraceae bacterium]
MTDEELRGMTPNEIDTREQFRFRLLVCHSSPCRSAGAEAVYEALVQTVKERCLDADVEVACIGCTAFCTDGPLVKVCVPGMEDVIYKQVTPELGIQILEEHVLGYERKSTQR